MKTCSGQVDYNINEIPTKNVPEEHIKAQKKHGEKMDKKRKIKKIKVN